MRRLPATGSLNIPNMGVLFPYLAVLYIPEEDFLLKESILYG
jgi:hypothetical protein